MREWRVINKTQGRLEIHDIRRVLSPGEWAIVAEPLPDSIKYLIGDRRVTVEEFTRPIARPKKAVGYEEKPTDVATATSERKPRRSAE